MNIKALITTFAIIGSSSVAMARPATFTADAQVSWTFGNTSPRPVVIRDHRSQPVQQPVRYEQPVRYYDDFRNERLMFPSNNVLTEDASVYKGPFPVANNRAHLKYNYYTSQQPQWISITAPTRIDRGRQFISDIPDFGAVSRMRLLGNAGQTSIEKVLVRFADGGEQVVTINRNLRINQSIDFQLNGARKVAALVVYGASSNGAAYQVLAI